MRLPLLRRAAISLAFTSLLLASGGCSKIRARMTVRDGNDLFKAEKYEKAIQKYEAALADDPSLTKIYRNIGLAYMAMFQPASLAPKDKLLADKSIEALQKYIESNPQDPRGPEYLVTMYLTASRYDQAIEHFQAVLARNADDLKTVQRLALVYQKKGDFENAFTWREKQAKLVTSENDKAEAYYTIGVLCWDRSYNYPDLEPGYRQTTIQKGISALNEAMSHRLEYSEAISYMNLLYREKAKYEWDPQKKTEYLQTATKYMMQALEIIKKRKAAAAATIAAPPAPPAQTK